MLWEPFPGGFLLSMMQGRGVIMKQYSTCICRTLHSTLHVSAILYTVLQYTTVYSNLVYSAVPWRSALQYSAIVKHAPHSLNISSLYSLVWISVAVSTEEWVQCCSTYNEVDWSVLQCSGTVEGWRGQELLPPDPCLHYRLFTASHLREQKWRA